PARSPSLSRTAPAIPAAVSRTAAKAAPATRSGRPPWRGAGGATGYPGGGGPGRGNAGAGPGPGGAGNRSGNCSGGDGGPATASGGRGAGVESAEGVVAGGEVRVAAEDPSARRFAPASAPSSRRRTSTAVGRLRGSFARQAATSSRSSPASAPRSGS